MKAFSLNIGQMFLLKAADEKIVKQRKVKAIEKTEVQSSAEREMAFARCAYRGNFLAGAQAIFHPLLFKPVIRRKRQD